jgi:hypothetical protein
MATYLLRASDQDMARWKAEAKIRCLPFSEFIRKSLDRATSSQARAVEAASAAERLGPDGAEAASTGGEASVDTGSGADRPPVPPPPVDLHQQARELAAKLQERVK